MPRSVQAYRQNAVVTNSPANTSSGDPTDTINAGDTVFAPPSMLDLCNPVTQDTQTNPFMSGLNTLGDGTGSTTLVPGQTGNMLSGLQQFTDFLCGSATGTLSTEDVFKLAHKLRETQSTTDAFRILKQLRDSSGGGTTPQSVMAGVTAVTGVINTTPSAQDAISTGQSFVGVSGNQVIDAVNGAQTLANQGHQTLTGQTTATATGTGLLAAGGTAINVNTAKHAKSSSISTAQSVVLKQENLLVSQNFSGAYTVTPDPLGQWNWDGTDGAETVGCLAYTARGSTSEFVSSEVDVVAGETIELSCFIKTVGLTYTGTTPAVFGVQKYRQMTNATGGTVYSDVGNFIPSTGQLTSPASSSGWTGVAATYTVEPGVDQVRILFQVSAAATSGTVKFDEAELLKLDLIPDAAAPGIGNTRDNIVTQLYGASGSGFNDNAAAVALAATASSLTSVTSQVAALQAEGHTGAIAGDDFNWSGKIYSNSDWNSIVNPTRARTSTNFGYYQSNGTDLTWISNFGGVSAAYVWLGSNSVSTTDYQLVQLVLDSAPSEGISGSFPPMHAYISLIGRANSAVSSYTIASIGSDGTWSVGYLSGTTIVPIGSGSGVSVPGAGSIISFYLGDAPTSRPRHYKVQVGTTTVAEFDETGTSSPLGTSNRQWGFGGTTQGNVTYESTLPSLGQWMALDQ